MPGWYIHLDVARKALNTLPTNVGAQSLFASGGPSAAQVRQLALTNSAYVALGAIGPDIFFLLPDFKPPMGSALWGAMSFVYDFYSVWDDVYLGPYQDQMSADLLATGDQLNAFTAGMLQELGRISSLAMSVLVNRIAIAVLRNFDAFSLLGSGVQNAYDEQTFFWSDMLHYRKTYDFAAHLWSHASDPDPDLEAGVDPVVAAQQRQAFALGWMSHLATDVTGHCFVNEKCGGPYRLHWQRHHLVENHMDAKVYDSEFGGGRIYQMLSNAALHLWLAFNPDQTSRQSIFAAQPGPAYDPGEDSRAALDRKRVWDVDSDMPDFLARYLSNALRAVYPPRTPPPPATDLGQCADHPTIISALVAGSDGYPTAAQIKKTYYWLFKYVKFTTTDYYKILRPDAPPVIPFAEFPSPPGTGASDPGPGAHSDVWHDIAEVLFAILAWFIYLGEIVTWGVSNLVALAAGPITYPAREALYEFIELPLYNAWAAMHWYLAMTGFTYPMQSEINVGLTTLGLGTGDAWLAVNAALDDLGGGLHVPATTANEPSRLGFRDNAFPRDVVVDPPTALASTIADVRGGRCGASEMPSEYMRPWLWPATDNSGHIVPPEIPLTLSGPYIAPQDATVLIGNSPGDAGARATFAACLSEAATIETANSLLPHGRHLGDPVDYTCFVVASLTRTSPGPIANFNLDADRGYGYLCWDWTRSHDLMAGPSAFIGYADQRSYHAPIRPGAGWCRDDLQSPTAAEARDFPHRPWMRDPAIIEANPAANLAVRIRYIDIEGKFT